MITFQLDECANSQQLARKCREQGLCKPIRFPFRLRNKGAKDPQVVAELSIQKGYVLVTTDLSIALDHGDRIPDINPGFILIGPCPGSPLRTTKTLVSNLLAQFKRSIPDWHTLNWNNSVVRLGNTYIEIGHMCDHKYICDFVSDLRQQGWEDQFRSYLAANRTRPPQPGDLPS